MFHPKRITHHEPCIMHHAQLPQAKVSILFYFCKQNRQNIHQIPWQFTFFALTLRHDSQEPPGRRLARRHRPHLPCRQTHDGHDERRHRRLRVGAIPPSLMGRYSYRFYHKRHLYSSRFCKILLIIPLGFIIY